jgi:hypothetical protein
MSITILTPNEHTIQDGKSDPTVSNFGGRREHSNTAASQDYTSRTGAAPDKKENPKDTAKDIDEMTEAESRKREFTRRDETSDVQKNNESVAVQSDSDRRPNEETDPVIVPEASDLKQQKKANKWQFDSSNRYEGEIS